MEFKILKKSKKSRARLGEIQTEHGVLKTPAFFPVATRACLKTLDSHDFEKIGFNNVLCNTYHLMLRPGSSLIKKMGGLHGFMNFNGVIATDSGGYQAFSLGKGIEQGIGKVVNFFPGDRAKGETIKRGLVKIDDAGVHFRSHLDGSKYFLGPEESMKIQGELGADIVFAFDECTSLFDGMAYTRRAMERTHDWARRCLSAKKNNHQALFGIVQGGPYKRLREESAEEIGKMDFDGFGIGGSLGKTKKRIFEILDWSIPLLPEEKPRHFLGIGYPEDFKESVKRGIDLFDCVYPTRMARHGTALTSKGKLNLNQAKFLKDKKRLDVGCDCLVCQSYSRSYISHLIRVNEITGMRLLTLHNLSFFGKMFENMRREIWLGKM